MKRCLLATLLLLAGAVASSAQTQHGRITQQVGTGTSTLDGLTVGSVNNILFVDGVKYAQTAAGLQAAHDALTSAGGKIVIPASFSLAAQVAFTKPVTLEILPGVTLTAASTIGAIPAITTSAPFELTGGQSARDIIGNVSNGSVIRTDGTFSNYLVEIKNTVHWSKAQNSSIKGVLLDCGAKVSKGIHIQNVFGVTVRDVSIFQPTSGIVFENTNSLFTEGSRLNNIWIYDPSVVAVDFILNGGTVSFDNLDWGSVYINLLSNNAIGIRVPATATLANGTAHEIKIWANAVNTLGFDFNGDGTAFAILSFMYEGQGGSGNVAWDATGVVQPMVVNMRVTGSGLAASPIVSGSPWGAGNIFGLFGGAQLAAESANAPSKPAYSFLGDTDTGFYSTGPNELGWSTGGTRRGFVSTAWVFEPDGVERARIDAAGVKGKRYFSSGTVLVPADFALSAGWGTTATISVAANSRDQDFEISIASSGTGQAANPTVTFTFKDGTFTNAPAIVCGRNDTLATAGRFAQTTISATVPVFTFVGTPVATETYKMACSFVGN